MDELYTVVETVLSRIKVELKASTYENRKYYFNRLLRLGEKLCKTIPCQELYDAFVADATTPDLRFQLYHAIKLVDAEARSMAFTPEGKLYNEPELPSVDESDEIFNEVSFPIEDGSVDTGHLVLRSMKEMEYLNLSSSTNWQYLQAWRELYRFLYLKGDTTFIRSNVNLFIESAAKEHLNGSLKEWKWKIQRRSIKVLLEVASTGQFEWKQFHQRKQRCPDETLEALCQQYILYLQTENLEKATIALYDYALRCLIEGTGLRSVSELQGLSPSHIQKMFISLSERLCLNSRGTIYPAIRRGLAYLYEVGIITNDYSGMILTPAYQRVHLRPYISGSDEGKLLKTIDESPLRTKAMMRLALRLGLRDTDICSLRFDQIDWKNDRISLRQKKTGVTQYLPLLEDVGNAIMEYIINERPKADKGYPYVFIRTQAPFRRLSSMYMICSNILNKADIETVNGDSRGVHVCRYTLTHKLLKAKVPHQVITDILGHVSKESDKPYISMEEEMLRECPLDLTIVGQKYWEEGDFCG